jgi:uncharacterized glyoxalase superfamily protein PhnB
MAKFTWDHIHLRSPNPEATAAFYERMFGAEVIRTMQQGKPRIDLKVGGANVFIMPVVPGDKTNPSPTSPYQGLDHFGLTVAGIDAVVADLKAKGPSSRWSRTTSAPAYASPSCAGRRVCRSSCSSARRLDVLAKIQGGVQREQLLPCRRRSLCRLCRIRLGPDAGIPSAPDSIEDATVTGRA